MTLAATDTTPARPPQDEGANAGDAAPRAAPNGAARAQCAFHDKFGKGCCSEDLSAVSGSQFAGVTEMLVCGNCLGRNICRGCQGCRCIPGTNKYCGIKKHREDTADANAAFDGGADALICSMCRSDSRERKRGWRETKRVQDFTVSADERQVRSSIAGISSTKKQLQFEKQTNVVVDARGLDVMFWARLWYYVGKFGWRNPTHVYTGGGGSMANDVHRWDALAGRWVVNELRIICPASERDETPAGRMERLFSWLERKGGSLRQAYPGGRAGAAADDAPMDVDWASALADPTWARGTNGLRSVRECGYGGLEACSRPCCCAAGAAGGAGGGGGRGRGWVGRRQGGRGRSHVHGARPRLPPARLPRGGRGRLWQWHPNRRRPGAWARSRPPFSFPAPACGPARPRPPAPLPVAAEPAPALPLPLALPSPQRRKAAPAAAVWGNRRKTH